MSANVFKLPYYAVIFASKRTELDRGYDAMATKMGDLASKQKGYLGIESARDSNWALRFLIGILLKILRLGKQMLLIKSHKNEGNKNGIVNSRYAYVKSNEITFSKCRNALFVTTALKSFK